MIGNVGKGGSSGQTDSLGRYIFLGIDPCYVVLFVKVLLHLFNQSIVLEKLLTSE